jgi:hypothetical protein
MNKWILYIVVAILLCLLYLNVTSNSTIPQVVQLGGTADNLLNVPKISELLDNFNLS